MKKKIIIAIVIVIAVVLLFPFPLRCKDGGTVKYQAILYCVSDVHRLAPLENDVGYEDGIIIEILGVEVFNNVTPAVKEGDRAIEEYDLIPMVMVDGVLYLDTGYNNTDIRKCGTPDGEITSAVEGSERPTENNQSNFGTGFGYQYGVTEGTIEIYMNDQWRIFATEEVRQQLQFGTSPSVQVYDVELSYANWTESELLCQKALNVELLEQSIAHHLPIYKFDTTEDLEQFKADFAGELTMDSGYDEVPSFNEVTAKYDKEFFKDTALFLVYIGTGNSTHRFGLDSIGWDDSSFHIFVEETTGAEYVDSAMAGWFLTVAVSSESVASCTEFDAVIGGIDLTLPAAPILRNPPALIVYNGEAQVDAQKSTSSWFFVDDNGDAVAINGDSSHPLLHKESMPVLDLVPTYLSGIDPLSAILHFGTAPNVITPDKVTVRCWPEDCWGKTKAKSEELPVTIENGNVFVQLKDDNYIYEVIAEWNNEERSFSGSVCYSFCTTKPGLEITNMTP